MTSAAVRVRVHWARGATWAETRAVRIEKGLAITKALDGRGWKITHLKSGYALDEPRLTFPTLREATAALDAFLVLSDWMKPEHVLEKDRALIEMGDLLCEDLAAELRA